MTLKNDENSEEELTCRFKVDIRNLTRVLESLKNLHFDWFCAKYITFDLKKYRGVTFHDTREWCKIWRKTDLRFGKSHEKFGKLSPEHLKVSKLELLFGLFVQSMKCMGLKFTGELCVMKMENDAKSVKELTY